MPEGRQYNIPSQIRNSDVIQGFIVSARRHRRGLSDALFRRSAPVFARCRCALARPLPRTQNQSRCRRQTRCFGGQPQCSLGADARCALARPLPRTQNQSFARHTAVRARSSPPTHSKSVAVSTRQNPRRRRCAVSAVSPIHRSVFSRTRAHVVTRSLPCTHNQSLQGPSFPSNNESRPASVVKIVAAAAALSRRSAPL